MQAKANLEEGRSTESLGSSFPVQASVSSGNDAKDELFVAIRNNPKIRLYSERIEFLSQFLLLFGILFSVFGIVSIFYKHKLALTLIGLASVLHVVAGPLGLVAVRNNNRYMLLSLALLNILWIGFVTLILVVFLFFKPSSDLSKQVFNREILIHVGMIVYMPIAAYTAWYCFVMLNELTTVHKELVGFGLDSRSKSQKSSSSKKLKKNIPTDIFQSFKETLPVPTEIKTTPKQ